MALNYSFAGKKVLVTGGGQGIGRQLIQRFHDDGAIVFTIDKNPESINALKTALPNVTAELIDICDWNATRKMIESFGIIDHLVNSAGIAILQSFLDITEDVATTQFNVNLLGIVNISQVVAKGLIASGRGGSIVNIASVAGKKYCPNAAIYGITKAGVENLTKSMAVELGAHNIRVNAIAPGFVDTPLLQCREENLDKQLETAKERLIIKRMIEPNEIADLVMFLLSPLSTMIVGETVLIDGGLMSK